VKTSNSTKIKNTSREILHNTIKKIILRTWTGDRTYNSCVGTPRSTWGGDRRWVDFFMCEG